MILARSLAIPVLLCVTAFQTRAQSATGELKPGATVRIRSAPSGPSKIKGTLISATRDSLVLTTKERQIAVARRDVNLLDVKRRRPRSEGALRMATWFGVIGAAVFGPATLSNDDYTCGKDQCHSEGGDVAQIAVTGLSFSLWGQAIGAIWPGSKWLPVAPISTTSNSISAPPRGSHVRITAPGYTAPKLEGHVATATSDSLSLIVRSSVMNIPMNAVTHLEYDNGSDRLGGAMRGLVQAAPAAAFYLSFAALEQTTDVYRNGVLTKKDSELVNSLVVGAGVVLGLGAGLGAIIAPPRWVERATSTGLLVQPGRHGTRVGLSVGF